MNMVLRYPFLLTDPYKSMKLSIVKRKKELFKLNEERNCQNGIKNFLSKVVFPLLDECWKWSNNFLLHCYFKITTIKVFPVVCPRGWFEVCSPQNVLILFLRKMNFLFAQIKVFEYDWSRSYFSFIKVFPSRVLKIIKTYLQPVSICIFLEYMN